MKSQIDTNPLLPRELCERYGLVPLSISPAAALIGMVDPSDQAAVTAVSEYLGRAVDCQPISRSEFQFFMNNLYRLEPFFKRSSARMKVGEVLLQKGVIQPAVLQQALALQKKSGDRLGQILVSHGFINRLLLSEALADQFWLPHIDLRKLPSDPEIVKRMDGSLCRRLGCVPVRLQQGCLIVAITDPTRVEKVHAAVRTFHRGPVEYQVASEFDIEWVTRAVFHDTYMHESIWGLFYRNPSESAYRTLTPAQVVFLLVSLLALSLGLVFYTRPLLLWLNGLIACIYLGISLFRFWIAMLGASRPQGEGVTSDDIAALAESDLPVYTILIPVFREKEVLPNLLASLARMDYPQSKLDIKLLLEESDAETREVVMRLNPPGNIEFITIPDSIPRTKPKACNYGLISARGKYLVIYDAEDKPEPDQLKKVLCVFKRGGQNLVCVQARLNYYNRNQNILTRWFTSEYSNWFDLILPGLDRMGLPIPLGGTSNHFVTEKLRELGGWDPFNVTEDADLGIRMYKHRCQTAVVDSTTFEEANSKLWNWIRQRTRWIKGYLQTFLVDLRHPFRLMRELGFKGLLGFFLTIGGTPFLFLINPFFWALTSISFLMNQKFLGDYFPPVIFLISSFNLLVGNFVFVYLNVISSFRRGYYELGRYALLSPIYWVLMSVAAWRALWQLFVNPFYWEKTTHGLFNPPGNKPPAE